MAYEYKVSYFVPKVSGCATTDKGWDEKRCQQFQEFLNKEVEGGWRLHSSEYRDVVFKGCWGSKGAWLVCIFERET